MIRNKMEKKKVIQPIGYRFSEEQSRKNKPSNHQIQLEKKNVNKLNNFPETEPDPLNHILGQINGKRLMLNIF